MKRILFVSLMGLSASTLASEWHYEGCADFQYNTDSFVMTTKDGYGVMIDENTKNVYEQATNTSLKGMTYVDKKGNQIISKYPGDGSTSDTPFITVISDGQRVTYKCPAGFGVYDKNGN